MKLGHQAPKGWRRNEFNSIEIDGDLHYCESHHFLYNEHEEKRKLYNGQPCYYTDNRFYDGRYNNFRSCMLYWTRFKRISLEACLRRAKKIKGAPAGTVIEFRKSYYHPGKKVNNSFIFKVKKEVAIDIEFKVNKSSYFNNFKYCEKSKALVDALRANGFLVRVIEDNDNFISSMISSAASYVGESIETTKEVGEIAIAYGHGKKIGFSSKNNTLFGYSDGCENILFDCFDEFNKWSRCRHISKDESVENIVQMLIEAKPEYEDEEI